MNSCIQYINHTSFSWSIIYQNKILWPPTNSIFWNVNTVNILKFDRVRLESILLARLFIILQALNSIK